MPYTETFKKIKNLIETHKRFVLLSHIHTDGDALGSLIGLQHYLESVGKEVSTFVPGEIPEKYLFLDTGRRINQGLTDQQTIKIAHAEVIFILDISNLKRLDKYYEGVKKSTAQKIMIDHHPAKQEWTQIALIDTQRIATAEMIYDLLKFLKADISIEIAIALYTAILSDSGSFRFFNTSPQTFQMAAELVDKGVEPADTYSKVYETARAGQLKAWGILLSKLQQSDGCTWIEVPQSFMSRHKLQLHEVDGLIDILRRENSAQVFMVIVEKERNEILVGLRSKDYVDVGKIARGFGGGGHFHASGYTSGLTLSETVQQTLFVINKNIKKVKK